MFSIYLFLQAEKIHTHLLNVVVRFIFFLNSANLICRGIDISKCFRESLGMEITRVDFNHYLDTRFPLAFSPYTIGNEEKVYYHAHKHIYVKWTLLPQFFGLVYVQQKGSLLSFSVTMF